MVRSWNPTRRTNRPGADGRSVETSAPSVPIVERQLLAVTGQIATHMYGSDGLWGLQGFDLLRRSSNIPRLDFVRRFAEYDAGTGMVNAIPPPLEN